MSPPSNYGFDTSGSTIGTGQELQYDDQAPDATVDTIEPDPTNPAWSEVTFSDGRKTTLPTSHAESLPQTPQAPPNTEQFGPPLAPMGPPEAPPSAAAPADAAPAPAAPAAPGVPPVMPTFGAGMYGGDSLASAMPAAPAAAATTLQAAPHATLAGAPQARPVDPNSAIVSYGSPGGDMVPAQQTTSTDQYAEDVATGQARLGDAANKQAGADQAVLQAQHEAKQNELLTRAAAEEAQQAELQRQHRQAQLETQEHQRVIKAIEDHPIDEEAYWTSHPGRATGAWIALALSGFLQGATKGQNPALAQMMASLNQQQDRWLQSQRQDRDSVLRRREAAMGHSQNAADSLQMQLNGLLSKRIDTDAQRAGVPPVPALETLKAQRAVDTAQRQTAIGQRITGKAEEISRATPGTGPQRQADVVLKNIMGPEYRKLHADAMDKKGLNLGGQVQGADELTAISDALKKLQGPDGQLAAQGVSLDKIGLAPFAARWGYKSGQDQVDARQLLERAKLAYKQTINIKSVDSENEGKNFNAIMDSGEGKSTVQAVIDRANAAKADAISSADGVAPGAAQQYIDYIRSTQQNNGYDPDQTKSNPERRSRLQAAQQVLRPGAGAGSGEAGAVSATTGGGPDAGGPLAPPSPGTPAPTATASTQSGTYQRGRFHKPRS